MDRAQALQNFKEFTGYENEVYAQQHLEQCGWDLERAIDLFFVRRTANGNAPAEGGEEESVIVDEEEGGGRGGQPQQWPPATRRISHYFRTANRQNSSDGRGGGAPQQQQPAEAQSVRAPPTHVSRGTHSSSSLRQVLAGSSHQNDATDVQMLDQQPEGGTSTSSRAAALTAHQQQQGAAEDNDNDFVRAPIPAMQGIVLDQSYRDTYQNGAYRRQRAPNPVFEQFYHEREGAEGNIAPPPAGPSSLNAPSAKESFDRLKAAQRTAWDKFYETQKIGTSQTDAHSSDQHQLQRPTSNNLRNLFRPPVEIMYRGDWDHALLTASQKGVWLLVNVQQASEFACQVLNRDIWSAESVREVIRANFLFWQVYHDSTDGQRIQAYYSFASFPAIFIVDPRSGELVETLRAHDSVSFLDTLTTFLDRFPTFESRDQHIRQIALESKSFSPQTSELQSNTDLQQNLMLNEEANGEDVNMQQQSLTASSNSSSSLKRERKRATNDVGNEDYDYEDEPDRQAKKMKRVVTISDLQPQPSISYSSTSVTFTIRNTGSINPEEWRQWEGRGSSTAEPIQLQFRLPDGRRQRISMSRHSPLRALFSVLVSNGLDPVHHLLVLDYPRREFAIPSSSSSSSSSYLAGGLQQQQQPSSDLTTLLLGTSLAQLGFATQETINVERRKM